MSYNYLTHNTNAIENNGYENTTGGIYYTMECWGSGVSYSTSFRTNSCYFQVHGDNWGINYKGYDDILFSQDDLQTTFTRAVPDYGTPMDYFDYDEDGDAWFMVQYNSGLRRSQDVRTLNWGDSWSDFNNVGRYGWGGYMDTRSKKWYGTGRRTNNRAVLSRWNDPLTSLSSTEWVEISGPANPGPVRMIGANHVVCINNDSIWVQGQYSSYYVSLLRIVIVNVSDMSIQGSYNGTMYLQNGYYTRALDALHHGNLMACSDVNAIAMRQKNNITTSNTFNWFLYDPRVTTDPPPDFDLYFNEQVYYPYMEFKNGVYIVGALSAADTKKHVFFFCDPADMQWVGPNFFYTKYNSTQTPGWWFQINYNEAKGEWMIAYLAAEHVEDGVVNNSLRIECIDLPNSVGVPPHGFITKQPESLDVVEGTDVFFDIEVLGSAGDYELSWYKNDFDQGIDALSTGTFVADLADNGAIFRAQARKDNKIDFSDYAYLTVQSLFDWHINTPLPDARMLNTGMQSEVFVADVNFDPADYTYQWYIGFAYTGETNQTFQFTAQAVMNGQNIWCVVSYQGGTPFETNKCALTVTDF